MLCFDIGGSRCGLCEGVLMLVYKTRQQHSRENAISNSCINLKINILYEMKIIVYVAVTPLNLEKKIMNLI